MPTAELCASLTDNHDIQYPWTWDPPWQSIFFTSAWLDLGLWLSLTLADFWLVCLPSWAGGLLPTGLELGEGTSVRNIKNIIMTAKCDWTHTQTNSRKLVMWPGTDRGSEPPLTSFDVIHPGQTAVKVGMFRQLTSHPNVRERQHERLLKTF